MTLNFYSQNLVPEVPNYEKLVCTVTKFCEKKVQGHKVAVSCPKVPLLQWEFCIARYEV